MKARTINASPMSNFLARARLAELQTIAVHCGLPKTGTKASLQNALFHELGMRRAAPSSSKLRILSVDMGIRNMALCLLQVDRAPIGKAVRRAGMSEATEPLPEQLAQLQGVSSSITRITRWARIGLSTTPRSDKCADIDTEVVAQAEPADDDPSLPQDNALAHAASGVPEDRKEAFDPVTMSSVAYDLVHSHFLSLKPTHILIEEQRHRSGSSFGILEWTYRVNMLEAMIHALLYSAREAHKSCSSVESNFPSVLSMSPKRMKTFWSQPDFLARLKQETGSDSHDLLQLPKGNAEKAERIMLTRLLLSRGLDCSSDEGVEKVRSAFLSPGRSRSHGTRKTTGDARTSGETTKKLDDLADCLLHGLAFVDWQIGKEVVRSACVDCAIEG